eukprot:Em0002g32a
MNQDVSKPTDLFRELLQKDKISHETPGALSAIYRNIGRIDLAIEVEQWSEVMEANRGVVPQNTFVGEALDDRLLNSVAREIGRDWKMLSRHLGLDETSIQSIQQAHFADLHEASYQALLSRQQELVGMVIGEEQSLRHLEGEVGCVLDSAHQTSTVMYVISLGVCAGYRQRGVASFLMQSLMHHVSRIPTCDVIYLHVLSTNLSAINMVMVSRYGGGVKIWWWCQDVVVVSRCGGGVKIWWWCQDVVVVSRCGGGVKIWWWCQDVVVVSRCGGGVKIWWWCQDVVVVSRCGGGVKIWWWCQDVVVVLRYGGGVKIWWCQDMVVSRYGGGVKMWWWYQESGETLVWMPSSLVGANALMWLHLEAS